MRKLGWIFTIVLGIILLAVAIGVTVVKLKSLKSAAFFSTFQNKQNISEVDLKNSPHNSGFFEIAPLIKSAFKDIDQLSSNNYWTQIGITSHHLPTALPFISEFYKNLLNSKGPRNTFVILGPDHFERCQNPISITKKPYLTPFGELPTDKEIVDKLLSAGSQIDEECFNQEHSVGVQTIFIKYLFPEAKIVPIIFSSRAQDEFVEKIADVLTQFNDRISIIISVDFSHYQVLNRASQLDQESEQALKILDESFFDFEHVDSPASIKLGISLAKKFVADSVLILGRANSYNFTNQTENTTGYLNVVFVDYKKTDNFITLMFVGDIMLSRQVGEKMKKINNWRWPFEKIADYLKTADLLFGNLEGPISDKGKNVGSIYSFRASPRVLDGLKYAGFDVLSVANNHIGDWSKIAMEDTFKILKENNIDYTGGGFSEVEAHSALIKEIKGTRVGFLSYTVLGSKYTEAIEEKSGIAWLNIERMKEDIEGAKKRADFIIISIHFGDEYKKKSNTSQQHIARTAIDAGASLVVGHHPHVIQEIEEYNGSYIAYSLGNFIFDQGFSKDTMEGLLLKVTVVDKKIKNIEPLKIEVSKEFQAQIAD